MPPCVVLKLPKLQVFSYIKKTVENHSTSLFIITFTLIYNSFMYYTEAIIPRKLNYNIFIKEINLLII